MATTYLLSVNLLKLQQARQIKDENPYTGEDEYGVFIPYKPNGIYVSERGYPYLTIFLNPLTDESQKYSHYAVPALPEDILRRITEEGTFSKNVIGRARKIKTI